MISHPTLRLLGGSRQQGFGRNSAGLETALRFSAPLAPSPPEPIREKYRIRDVTAYTKASAQSPCLYINEP